MTLVHFAGVDATVDSHERDLLIRIGKRLGLSDDETAIILSSNPPADPVIPGNELERYILFDDIMNMIVSNKVITQTEELEVVRIAVLLGFAPEMAEGMLKNAKRHLELGFDANQLARGIKDTLFSFTYKTESHEKYSL